MKKYIDRTTEAEYLEDARARGLILGPPRLPEFVHLSRRRYQAAWDRVVDGQSREEVMSEFVARGWMRRPEDDGNHR